MTIEIKVPDLGDGIEHGDVLSVLVREGDVIKAEQGIVELETDKAVAEVPSPKAGRVAKVHVKAGDCVPVGGTLLTLEEAAAEIKIAPAAPAAASKKEAIPAAKQASPPSAPKPAPAKQATAPAAKEPEPNKAAPAKAPRAVEKLATVERKPSIEPDENQADHFGVAAGPAIRRLARELGLDLGRVEANGEGGRITKEDIMRTVRAANRATIVVPQAERSGNGAAAVSDAVVLTGEPDDDKWGPIVRDRVTRIRATIAERMQQSAATIPHVTNFDDADITELEKIRQANKADYEARDLKLTTLPFVIKAVALSLRRHPVVNASLDLENGQIIYKQYVNVGVAVDTDRGLIVPNIRNADQLSMPQIAQALDDLSRRARASQFSIDDLRGGTFTISNLGAVGGTYSTPIINAPEVAILLLGRSRRMPVVVGDDVKVRLMMPLSLSYDHRLVDGAAAARFLNEVKSFLESPGRLLMAP